MTVFMPNGTHSPETSDEPDWTVWTGATGERFNPQVLGEVVARREGSLVRVRMIPRIAHTNLTERLHGGAVLGFIDAALFPIYHMHQDGMDRYTTTHSVTVDLATQFLGAGRHDLPLDAVGEVLRETSRFVFVRGVTEQTADDGTVSRTTAFQATLRKPSRR